MLLQIPDNGDKTWRNIDNAGIADMNIWGYMLYTSSNTRPAIGDTRNIYTSWRS
jgi:hypothetical protein